ncbi:hypothetical protein T4E_1268 [Trichinella pseudospiralis]|uniref:Uncharacterized protein n=1 Tax=Trichinella pseudospiralis TaxID=6337 RepID=A0A0V0XID1_TRIPS|nr:hypothetical protein T4E_1268 [Trichinella pseudospiralis]
MRFEVSWKIRRRSEAQPAACSVRKLLCMWWQKNRSRSAKKNTHDKQKCFSGRNLWTHEGTVSERKCSVAWWQAAPDPKTALLQKGFVKSYADVAMSAAKLFVIC